MFSTPLLTMLVACFSNADVSTSCSRRKSSVALRMRCSTIFMWS
jgi:hypothetical protein